MRRLSTTRVVLFTLLCALAGVAGATSLMRWDVTELSRRSTAVVQGRVLHVTPRWASDGMKILTDVDVQVEAVWRGSVPEQVRITQPGGRMPGFAQRVDGTAAFQEGEEVVVFLDPRPDATFVLTGMAQGKYRIDRSQGVRAVPEALTDVSLIDPQSKQKVSPALAPVPLEVLRAQVRAATP